MRVRARPPSVCVEEETGLWRERPDRIDVEQRHGVLGATSAAHSCQPTALVTVDVDGNDVDLGTDDPAVEREPGLVLEHLAERRELLVLPVRVDDDLPDPLIDHIAHVATIRGTTPGDALSCSLSTADRVAGPGQIRA